VCGDCGYVERYISDQTKLAEIARKWDKVEPEDAAKEKD
jgi:hypothetical protein